MSTARPEVSVYIQTYQQRPYIRDAIEGVLAQRRPFEIEILIADDFSTDGTREVLEEYRRRHPELIRLLLPEQNLGPTEIFRRAVRELRGEFVAWLDGDDYWSEPEKLARQVEALRSHPDWAGCFHDATVRQVDGNAPDRSYVGADLRGPIGFVDLLRSNPVPSLSVMARGELIRNLPDWVWEGLWSDWLSILAVAQHGGFGYLPEPMGVYRVHGAGISSGLSRSEQLEEDLRLYELLGRVVDGPHRADVERAVRARRGQMAVERSGVPFSGAVAVLALGSEAPTYLNGRELWTLAGAEGVAALEAGDRDGTLGARLERMRHDAAAVAPGVAHFPESGQPQARAEGGLYLLVVGALVDWFDRYSRLGRQLEGAAEVVWRDDDCVLLEVVSAVGAPAPMGALVEIEDVSPAEGGQGLFRAHLDAPAAGSAIDAHTVGFAGWAIGEERSPVVAVELARDGEAFRRVPLGVARPDLESAFPERSGIGNAGFETSVSLVGNDDAPIEVRAVLKDQRRVPIAGVQARRRWREALTGPAPLVSVVIPCYEQAPYLEEAIGSVLAQTYAQVEVIVVDDGSPDNTPRIASRFPGVRCVRQPNQGLAGARNAGIRESEGELVVFLDADDRLLPRALETGVAQLRDHPEAAFAFGRYHRMDPQGSRLEDDEQPRPDADPYSVFLRYNFAGVPATGIYRRSALEEAGNFDETLPGAEDYDLGLRLAREHTVLPHAEFVAEYRVHGGSMSRDAATMLEMTQQALYRQRRHTRRNGNLRDAYRQGRSFWRRYYGEPLVAQVKTDFANREWGEGLRGAAALMRLYPRGLGALLRRSRS